MDLSPGAEITSFNENYFLIASLYPHSLQCHSVALPIKKKSLFPYLLSMAWPCGLLVILQWKCQFASSTSGAREALHASPSQILLTTM